MRRHGAAILFSVGLAASVAGAHAEPLVTAEWLNAHRADPDLVVLDIRSAIDGGGAQAYATAHIPGSVHSDYDKGGWRVTRNNVPFMVPTKAELEKLIGDLGVDEDSHVVVVPAGVNVLDFGSAARTYWTLKVAGVPNVSILDGGYAAWVAAGGNPESGEGLLPTPAQFVARPMEGDSMDVEALQRALDGGSVHLLDARAPERFRGDVEPVDRVAGRIPGAINAPSGDQLRGGFFRTPEELRDYYTALGVLDGAPIVVSCGSGVTACVNLVAMELAGISGAQLCPGSFSGWIAHGLPVERGPAP